MGGTSTDVSLIDETPKITSDAKVGGHPIRVPVLDIHTIGAGGGSIAYVDAGGVLRVGPESAGADPGPACYGKYSSSSYNPIFDNSLRKNIPAPSDQHPKATVTDANLYLGRIHPDYFLGGEMRIFPEQSVKAIEGLGSQLNLNPDKTALGIIEIANAHMERALRVISVEQGHDPRAFTLLSFGGAGGLHAAALARRLKIPRVLIPPQASTLSAFGMLAADVVKDYSQTVMLPGITDIETIRSLIQPLADHGQSEILNEGFLEDNIIIEKFLDLRYRGQSYELTVQLSGGEKSENEIIAGFHQKHLSTFGYNRPDAETEIVNIRVRAAGKVTPPVINQRPRGGHNPKAAQIGFRKVSFERGNEDAPFYSGELLEPGNQITGPSVILRNDTTILLDLGDEGHVDSFGNLIVDVLHE